MLRIQFDTSSLFETIVKYRKDYQDFFIRLYNLHQIDELRIVIPEVVVAEFYGILRAGRTGKYIDGEYRQVCYTHRQILNFIHTYPHIFNMEFIEYLNTNYKWRAGSDESRIPLYKKDFYNVVKNRMGWDDWGKETIEKQTRKSLKILGIQDQYDYPIMASALEYDVHLLITENLKHFAKPLGSCIVVNIEQARLLDLYDDYFELMDIDDWE